VDLTAEIKFPKMYSVWSTVAIMLH